MSPNEGVFGRPVPIRLRHLGLREFPMQTKTGEIPMPGNAAATGEATR